MFNYPANLLLEKEGAYTVTFDDIPEAITYGSNKNNALFQARDALGTALSFYLDTNKDIPPASAAKGRPLVAPDNLDIAKLHIYLSMRQQGLKKSDLARMLNWHKPQVDRILDLTHVSKFDQLEKALAALGKSIVLDVKTAA